MAEEKTGSSAPAKKTGKKAIKDKLVQAVKDGDLEKQNRYRNQLRNAK